MNFMLNSDLPISNSTKQYFLQTTGQQTQYPQSSFRLPQLGGQNESFRMGGGNDFQTENSTKNYAHGLYPQSHLSPYGQSYQSQMTEAMMR
jgi:hypothetical protein